MSSLVQFTLDNYNIQIKRTHFLENALILWNIFLKLRRSNDIKLLRHYKIQKHTTKNGQFYKTNALIYVARIRCSCSPNAHIIYIFLQRKK